MAQVSLRHEGPGVVAVRSRDQTARDEERQRRPHRVSGEDSAKGRTRIEHQVAPQATSPFILHIDDQVMVFCCKMHQPEVSKLSSQDGEGTSCPLL